MSGFFRKICVGFVRLYQILFSPWLKTTCCFFPSCSSYAIESLQKKNLGKALILIVWRLLRCHPWQRGGWDPVR